MWCKFGPTIQAVASNLGVILARLTAKLAFRCVYTYVGWKG